jgi:hypothetical protein
LYQRLENRNIWFTCEQVFCAGLPAESLLKTLFVAWLQKPRSSCAVRVGGGIVVKFTVEKLRSHPIASIRHALPLYHWSPAVCGVHQSGTVTVLIELLGSAF